MLGLLLHRVSLVLENRVLSLLQGPVTHLLQAFELSFLRVLFLDELENFVVFYLVDNQHFCFDIRCFLQTFS
jgi:hypothetical protein